jgi:DNA-binding transcriptional MerR regulator
MEDKIFNLDKLSALTGLNRRTVRYYIQIGLLSRPIGGGRGAHYTERHLGELLQIKKLTSDGFSLEAVRRIISDLPDPSALRPRPVPGSVTVRSHILLAPGIELQISPEESGLTAEEIRSLIQIVLEAAGRLLKTNPGDD